MSGDIPTKFDYVLNVDTTSASSGGINFKGLNSNVSNGYYTTTDGQYHWHSHSGCSICNPYWHISYTYPTYPTTIYMYQIQCPKCDTKTFGQLDAVVTCKKCKSTIKLVSKVTDYEVAVDL